MDCIYLDYMPHISKYKLKKRTMQELEERVMLFLSTTSMKTRQEIFRELFTPTERLMIAKRLSLIFLITEQASSHEISKRLRVSSSTAMRFQNAVSRNAFAGTIKWLARNKKAHAALRFIADLVAVPFEAQNKSLARFMDER